MQSLFLMYFAAVFGHELLLVSLLLAEDSWVPPDQAQNFLILRVQLLTLFVLLIVVSDNILLSMSEKHDFIGLLMRSRDGQ